MVTVVNDIFPDQANFVDSAADQKMLFVIIIQIAMDRSPAQSALVRPSQALDPSPSVPVVLERAGAKALFAADEFVAARISNPHTRRAYARVARHFLA